jgi:hypothetical protein
MTPAAIAMNAATGMACHLLMRILLALSLMTNGANDTIASESEAIHLAS